MEVIVAGHSIGDKIGALLRRLKGVQDEGESVPLRLTGINEEHSLNENAAKLAESGIPLNAGNSRKEKAEINPSSRAQTLLAGTIMTEHDILDLITDMVQKAKSQRSVAQALEISDSYLNDVLQGKRSIGASLVRKMGYAKVMVFVAPGDAKQIHLRHKKISDL
jgi:predicted XRE-type DNA-binding protein